MKKTFRALLCFCLIFTMLASPVMAAGQFKDVATNSYCYTAVNWAVAQNITSGTGGGKFSPDKTCTTAEILTFLWRAAGCPEPFIYFNPFGDVSEDAYYYKAAAWAYGRGMLTLKNGIYFQPNTPCTRASTVEYIWYVAGCPDEGTATFSDVKGEYNVEQSIAWAVDYGVTAGTGNGKFSPNATCTRGQIVTLLYRYFVEPLEKTETTTPAPAPKPAPADMAKLDPLPPKELSKQPDWYMSLTNPDTMSNERLVAEYERLNEYMDTNNQRTEVNLVRSFDLEARMMRRMEAIRSYNQGVRNGYIGKYTMADYEAVCALGDISVFDKYL